MSELKVISGPAGRPARATRCPGPGAARDRSPGADHRAGRRVAAAAVPGALAGGAAWARTRTSDPDAGRPGAAAWRAGAGGPRSGGRCRRWRTGCCWRRSRACRTGTSSRSREMPGFGEALYRLVRELKGAGYRPLEPGSEPRGCDRCAREGGIAWRSSLPRSRRAGMSSTALTTRCWRPTPTGWAVSGCWSTGCSTCRRRWSGCWSRSPSGCPSRVFAPDVPAAADAPLAETLERLAAAGATLETAPGHAERDTALDRVRAALFTRAGAACRSRPTERCDWCRRRTRPGRCERPRGRALQWAREGRRFWEMAVAYRHGDAYRPLVESVFIEAGIPVYLHEGSPLAERPVGRQTLGAARPVRDGPLAPVGDGFHDRRAVPEGAAGGVRRDPGGPVGLRAHARPGSSAGLTSGRRGSRRCSEDLRGDGDEPDWVTERIADVAQARAVHRRPAPSARLASRQGAVVRSTSTICRRCSAATSTAATR